MAAVLVHIDLDDGRPHAASLAAIAAGRAIASEWGACLYGAVIMDRAAPPSSETEAGLVGAGLDKLVCCPVDAPVAPLWSSTGHAWTAVIERLRPRVVLFGADAPSAIELAARTASRIGARLFTRARLDTSRGELALRDRDGSRFIAGDSGAAVAFVAPRIAPRAGDPEAAIEHVTVTATEPADTRITIASREPASSAERARRVVVLGADASRDDAVVAAARSLASALGATVVGDDTTTLAPDLCVAIGATRHLDIAGATTLVTVDASDVSTLATRLGAP